MTLLRDMIRLSAIRRELPAFILICLFLFALTLTTLTLYVAAEDHSVLRPENILEGKSQAPNQYRILAPLLIHALDGAVLHDAERSDRAVIFISILLAYIATGALFYKTSGSTILSMLALLALLGCFALGMTWKYRQEFFETAFVASSLLVLLSMKRLTPRFFFLAVLTLLGSLNRETFFFCLTGIAAHVFTQRTATELTLRRKEWLGLALLFVVFGCCTIGVRWYYGMSDYHGPLWMAGANVHNLLSLKSANHFLFMGGGVLFIFIMTVLKGNRMHLPFIVGYGVPLLLTAFFISSFDEHRIFYPLMMLMISSIVGFVSQSSALSAAEKP